MKRHVLVVLDRGAGRGPVIDWIRSTLAPERFRLTVLKTASLPPRGDPGLGRPVGVIVDHQALLMLAYQPERLDDRERHRWEGEERELLQEAEADIRPLRDAGFEVAFGLRFGPLIREAEALLRTDPAELMVMGSPGAAEQDVRSLELPVVLIPAGQGPEETAV